MGNHHPTCAYTQEVRFAVVMYGGVSLAIYMNGITQELYRLVRATAPNPDGSGRAFWADEELSGTEKVYRSLGRMIRRGEPVKESLEPSDRIATRFVIDILSGTSAGGINAIFLSKALANNQSIDQLKDLWVNEGDIRRLINDRESVVDIPLPPQRPPQSLLNSGRMYYKLLAAFDGMDRWDSAGSPIEPEPSPYVDELDLFVTATDIRGVPVPLRLSDTVVFERRHRRDFHFSYRNLTVADLARNDFHARENPFLAFSARCTSSFPFAFEPMTLADIDTVLPHFPHYKTGEFASSSTAWRRYAPDYDPDGPCSLPCRAFGDGGYLDNKPFSYAIEMLTKRQADVPVDRKLIYIEPSPAHPEDGTATGSRPDAIENVMAATMKLPRYETIREDLQRVLDWNRKVGRLDRILSGIEDDIRLRIVPREGLKEGLAWAGQDLAEMIRQKGAGYGAYHRLKVGLVTDDIAELVSRLAGFDEQSDQFLAIQTLVREWRSRNYRPVHQSALADDLTENRFLFDFDLRYRMRRINFVRRKLDMLFSIDWRGAKQYRYGDTEFSLTPGEVDSFRAELLRIKGELNSAFKVFRSLRGRLWSRRTDADAPPREGADKETQDRRWFGAAVTRLGISNEDLLSILGHAVDTERRRAAGRIFDAAADRVAHFEEFAEALKTAVGRASRESSRICKQSLETPAGFMPSTAPDHARACLWHYYQYYEDYDMVILPMLFCADIGEADAVEVIRISPEDATSLIDERHGDGRKKLAGVSLGHFGAFLEKAWRVNDILWGRLDGAERIISALLPGDELLKTRKRLIREAHEAILREDLVQGDRTELCRLLADAIMRTGTTAPSEEGLLSMVQAETGSPVNPKLQAILRSCLHEKQLLKLFSTQYEIDRTPNPKIMLESLSRSTRVVGTILESVADRHGQKSKVSWVARLGQVFWGLVTVAVPGSLADLFFRHWLKMLYAFEAVLIGLSLLLGNSSMKNLGFTALGITAAVHILVQALGDYMRGKKRSIRNIGLIIAAVLVFFAVIGIDRFFSLGLFGNSE